MNAFAVVALSMACLVLALVAAFVIRGGVASLTAALL